MAMLNTILIDDNDDDLFFTELVLRRADPDVPVVKFNMAQEAIRALTAKEAPPSGLLLVDINMPGMDGFEFLTAYEALPDSVRDHYVCVMLTSSFDDRDRQRAAQFHSVKGYMNKPLNQEDAQKLLQQVRSEWLKSET